MAWPWLVLTFGLRPATGKTLVFSDASFQNGGEPLVPLPFAKGAILSPSQDGRDRSSVPSSSVRISPAPPRSLRPNHFYFKFVLTASLVTRRRTLVLYTHSGTEERRETGGRTRKTPKVKRLLSIRWDSPPRQKKRQIKTLPPSRRTWAVTSQNFDMSRFDKRRLHTLLEAPIHFCPNKTPVNLGAFVIRGGRCVVYEDRRYCTRASCEPKPQGFVETPSGIVVCVFHFRFRIDLSLSFRGTVFPRASNVHGVASTRKTISQVTGAPLLRTRDRSIEFLMSVADAAPGSVLSSQSTLQAYCR
ncbi:hypothetical protein EDB83DRAFT_2309474 [Lactarius deliciosus]|nr:hypothetical protein EDB83DRAFT_2309474 [Lactarius deliciosus]